MSSGDTARLLHRLTSYEPSREWTTPVDDPLRPAGLRPERPPPTLPPQFGRPTRRGCRRWRCRATGRPSGRRRPPCSPAGTTARRVGTSTCAGLARLLYLSAGVVRWSSAATAGCFFRASGSAGGRFPLEAVRRRPRASTAWPTASTGTTRSRTRCVRVGPPPDGEATTIVRDRRPLAHRLALRRARLPAPLLGRRHDRSRSPSRSPTPRASPRGCCDDVPRRGGHPLVGADGVHEFPLALVTLGDGEPAIRPGGDGDGGDVDARARSSSRSSRWRSTPVTATRARRAVARRRPAAGRAAAVRRRSTT